MGALGELVTALLEEDLSSAWLSEMLHVSVRGGTGKASRVPGAWGELGCGGGRVSARWPWGTSAPVPSMSG